MPGARRLGGLARDLCQVFLCVPSPVSTLSTTDGSTKDRHWLEFVQWPGSHKGGPGWVRLHSEIQEAGRSG